MNRTQIRRLEAIERSRILLSAAVRRWLGEPVTDDNLANDEPAHGDLDLSALNPETRLWLSER